MKKVLGKRYNFHSVLFFLVQPFMLALYVLAIALFFIPEYFQKYTAEIIDTKYHNDFIQIYYHDLDGDGISEKIITGYNGKQKDIRIQHFNLNNKVYDQWMPRGKWLHRYKPVFGDYNHNGFAEIYCLSIDNDSIFLSIKELMLDGGLEIKNRFVCKAGTFENKQEDVIDCGGRMMDINKDGLSEYVFFLHGGFSKYPRNVFAYYLSKDSLVMSPKSASGLDNNLQFMDINGDGVDEITGLVGAPENIHYPMPYTDSAAWLMVFDPHTMDFHFPPIRFDLGISSWVKPVFFSINNKKYLAAAISSNSAEKRVDYIQLKLFDGKGKFLKENYIDQGEIQSMAFINPLDENDGSFYLMDNSCNTYKTDTSLNLSLLYNPDVENIHVIDYHYKLMDIDGDGKNELMLLGGDTKANNYLLIYRQNLKDALTVELPGTKTCFNSHLCLINDGTQESPILLLQIDNYVYKIKYRKSPWFVLKYPAYVAAYVLLFLAFWLLQRIQSQYAQRKFEEEKRLAKMQMALSIRQLEPHFMLNTLNNIGQMFAAEEKEKAQFYFGKFASLIHRGLKYADKTETTLFEELGFIRDYLILQQRRYNDLEFSIEADENIDLNEILIPHSLVYTFVENALKHGLYHKKGKKNLNIQIIRIDGKIQINITDNGIGLKQSKEFHTTGTGKGLGIITSIVEGYNKLNKRNITFKTFDLDEGTEVRIEV